MSYGAFQNYKHTFICLECRKGFKKPSLWAVGRRSEWVCPQCKGILIDMGIKFKTPKMSDLKAWNNLALKLPRWLRQYQKN